MPGLSPQGVLGRPPRSPARWPSSGGSDLYGSSDSNCEIDEADQAALERRRRRAARRAQREAIALRVSRSVIAPEHRRMHVLRQSLQRWHSRLRRLTEQEQAAECIQAHWRGCVGRRRFKKLETSRRQELYSTLASLQEELEMLNATMEATRPLVGCLAALLPLPQPSCGMICWRRVSYSLERADIVLSPLCDSTDYSENSALLARLHGTSPLSGADSCTNCATCLSRPRKSRATVARTSCSSYSTKLV